MKTVIEMAREAGFTVCRGESVFREMLECFAALIASAEREACIEACWALELNDWEGRAECIDAIEARSNT